MDIVAVGVPGALSAWGFRCLENLLRELKGDVSLIHLDRYDRVDDLGQDTSTRLILSQFPNPDFAVHCGKCNIPVFVFADTPLDAVNHLCKAGDQSVVAALRATSAGLVLCLPFMRHPNSILVQRGASTTYIDVLKAVLPVLVSRESIEKARQIVSNAWAESLSLDDIIRRDIDVFPGSSLDQKDAELVEQVLGSLYEFGLGGELKQVVWPRQCFLNGDSPDTVAPDVFDLTGGSRVLYYGPYYHLPAGRWRVSIVLSFSHDTRGMSFTLKLANADHHDEAKILVERGGVFAADFDVCIHKPFEAVEVLIMNDKGAIEGAVGLQTVTFDSWEPSFDYAANA
jgi:hypothetical protein